MSEPTSTSVDWVRAKSDRFNLQTIDITPVVAPESQDEPLSVPQGAPKGESKDMEVFTAEDKALLLKLEGVIAANIGAFLRLGEALAIIKGRELQRVLEPKLTFERYCEEKWGFGQSYAYRLIRGYECVKNLRDNLAPKGVKVFPTNEAQVRPLASLPPEDQVKIWSRVLKEADGAVTAVLVENIAHGTAANKAAKAAAVESPTKTEASAEYNKLKAIAKLVEKALSDKPTRRSIKKLSAVLMRIQDLLIDIE